ncbi:MAG TPA: LTA synthase family protein [Polyangia bacterium]|nr:LTA synthase family protein [Polyangia bacterium]
MNRHLSFPRDLYRRNLVRTAPVALFAVVQALVIACLQVRALGGSYSLPSALCAWSPSAATFLVLVAVANLALAWAPSVLAVACLTIYYLAVGTFVLISAMSHAYFLSTRINLSWSIVSYSLNGITAVGKIMGSEASLTKVAFLAGQGLVFLLALGSPCLPALRRWAAGQVPRGSKRLTLVGALLTAGVLFAVPRPQGRMMALGRCVPADMLVDAISAGWSLRHARVTVEDHERMDRPLTLIGSSGPRPNIVLIIFESLAWKYSDVYFPGKGLTPFLGSLARQSLVVEQHYTVLPHTTKALVPILCGMYPYLGTQLKETIPGILPPRCIPHVLREQGYRTAFFQPAGNFEDRDQLVWNMGFDTFRGLNELPGDLFEDISYFGKEDKVMIRPSVDWIEKERDQPFFLTYLTLASHHNYVAPQSFPQVSFGVSNSLQNRYMNAVRYTDDFIKELLRELERHDLISNTVFILVGDHGEAFGEHGRGTHDNVMWEEGLRTLALIYSPSYFPRPGKITGIRSNLDLLPTVCDLLELRSPDASFLGSSLLREVPIDRELFFSCWFDRHCLARRTGQLKVIYNYGMQPAEVYDNLQDPLDLRDLAHSGPYDEVFLDGNQQKMLRWRAVVSQQYEDWERTRALPNAFDRGLLAPPGAMPLFGQELALAGHQITPSRILAGQRIQIRLFYRYLVCPRGSGRFRAQLLVRHDNGSTASEVWDLPDPLSSVPYSADCTYRRDLVVQLPRTWPAGEASFAVRFWDSTTPTRALPVEPRRGQRDGAYVVFDRRPVARTGSSPICPGCANTSSRVGRWP